MWNMKSLVAVGILFATSLALTAWQSHSKGKQAGMDKVQALWTAERLAIATAQAEQTQKARKKEQELQDQLAKQKRVHQNEIRRIQRDHIALVDSLRNRTERPESITDVPKDSPFELQPLTGCTGSELYREDGTFLVGEAARADQLRIALQACIADRIEIERTLNQLSP
jgi:hypothetical protein